MTSTSSSFGARKIVLVVGATGATGRLLVAELLKRGIAVRAVARSAKALTAAIGDHPLLSIVEASLLDLGDDTLKALVADCQAVASCLGHKINLRSIFGPPRRLVTEATCRLCHAIVELRPAHPVKFVLMNTAGNTNRHAHEKITLGHRAVIALVRLLLPPHADNEQAAEALRKSAQANPGCIEWAAVRPDTLIDESAVSAYEIHASPTRSAVFDAGRTSRINVAHFMAELIDNDETWRHWRGAMPVIYNRGFA